MIPLWSITGVFTFANTTVVGNDAHGLAMPDQREGNPTVTTASALLAASMDAGKIPTPTELADRLAIQDVLALHCRGVDRADESALKTAYWPDAQVAYGGFNGAAHEFCEMLPVSITHFAKTLHSISNVLIQFSRDGQRAAVETYVTAYHYSTPATTDSERDSEMTFLGRYLDRFERRDNHWKIAHRRVLMDWNQNTAASAIHTGAPFEGLAQGSRLPTDPVYALLSDVIAGGTQ